jgi:hypothetical protein
MKKLNLEQMENVNGGKFLACLGQVAGGMGVLGTVASIGIWSLGPVGWVVFGLGAVALAADMAADPYACD